MGEVYRAKDTRLERTVAIKVLPSHLRASRVSKSGSSARPKPAVSSLNHPHICTLHDVGSEDGVDFMVLELIERTTLADRLRRGKLSFEQAIEAGGQITDALDKAHRRCVVHRDLKPGKIMLTSSDGRFLVSKRTESADHLPPVTELVLIENWFEELELRAARTSAPK